MIEYKDIEPGRVYHITHSNYGIFEAMINEVKPEYNRCVYTITKDIKTVLEEGVKYTSSLDLVKFDTEVEQ